MKKFVSLVIAVAIMASMCLMAIPASAADYNNNAEYQTFTNIGMNLFDMANPDYGQAQVWLRDPEAYHITYFEAKGEFDAVRFSAWSDDLGTQKWLFQILEEDGETVIQEVEQIVKQGADGINIVKFNPIPAGNYAFKVSTVEDYEPGNNNGNPKYYVVMPAGEILEDCAETCYTEIVGALTPTDTEGMYFMDMVSAIAFGIHLTGNGMVTDSTEAPTDETEAPADETEAPADETEAPADETEAPADETEAPADETEAPADPTTAPDTADKDSDSVTADDEGGLSTPVLIGIIAGAVVIIAAAAVMIYFFVIKKK